MTKKLLVDDCPEMGVKQYMLFDNDIDSGGYLITEQDVDSILDGNAKMRSLHTQAPKGDQTFGSHVGRIPMALYLKFCKEDPELAMGTTDAHARLVAKLNSRDYCHLKTYAGKA